MRFVIRAASGREPVSALCREFGVSRPTGYWRREEAQAEFAAVKKMHESSLAKDLESFGEGRMPNPELTREPQ